MKEAGDTSGPISSGQLTSAILSDVQFWVPCLVLICGIVLLGLLH